MKFKSTGQSVIGNLPDKDGLARLHALEHARDRRDLKNLVDAEKPQDVLDILKNKFVSDPFLNPYRTKSPWLMQTTGQILMDLKNLEVVVRMDRDEGVFRGIVNKLPTGYKPKIKLKIEH